MRELPSAVGELAEDQAGVVSRAQLRALGIDRHGVRSQVAARRWQVVGPRVVVLTTGTLTRTQRFWVAVLHAGRDAGLAGRSATEAAGLVGWRDDAVHVAVPWRDHARVPRLPGVVVHQTRRFAPGDLLSAAAPPRFRTQRAVLDGVAWTPAPRPAIGLLAASVQQRLVTPQQLRRELDLGRLFRHDRIARLALADIEGGAHALSEIDVARECRARGLPEPDRQVVRVVDGRRRYLDSVFRLPDGTLVMEIDGALHMLVGQWWDDLDRQNELVIRGERVIRFPSMRIRLDPDHCFGQLARALQWHRAA